MQTTEIKELDLRNLDIVTEVSEKGAAVDTCEPFEVWTFTFTRQL